MLNKEQAEQIVTEVCPNCASGMPVERRKDTGEWIHRPQGPMSIRLCLASHFREKYKDVLNG
jgi:hypothetical protein